MHSRPDKEISLKTLAQIINARVEEILELINTELKAYGAYEQKKKLIAGIVLTGGGSNLKHIRQFTNYMTGFDSRLGFANEYIANDKNQLLKGPEFATSIGLLMESLKIREKKSTSNRELFENNTKEIATEATVQPTEIENHTTIAEPEIEVEKKVVQEKPLTIGERILRKVKNFFEEVEE